MPTKIQMRRGTETEWSNADPVLSQSEFGHDLTNDIVKIGDGTKKWSELSPLGGSGGVGGLVTLWGGSDSVEPIFELVSGVQVFDFTKEDLYKLRTTIKVPSSYSGKQIKLKIDVFTPSTATLLKYMMRTTATLVRVGTDSITSTTNTHDSTNSSVSVPSVANQSTSIELDLTDANGEVNGVAVSAGDLLLVDLSRIIGDANDTLTNSVLLLPESLVSFE